EYIALCPLSATKNGIDGRSVKGHVDDYWININSTAADPFIGNWTEHVQGECTADFMGTNQSLKNNPDGQTTFYYDPSGDPLEDFAALEPGVRDGCHGLRLFAESRGFTVVTNYTQYILGWDGKPNGFTYENFKSEINAGRPVLIHVTGHTMLGFGYNDTGNQIYIHDTWDYSNHAMTWGGSYDGMAHVGVSVLQLEPGAVSGCPDCSGDVVYLESYTFRSGTVCECTATTSITTGPGVTIENGATVTFTAPSVTTQPGFLVEEGALFHINQQ
ncbi:MAG: hypothetical protein V1793_10190, partial [Pseudomonadota bacterium]